MLFRIFIFVFIALMSKEAFSEESLSDSQIKKAIIQESIMSYTGNCPCPYNYARNGSRCGKRSAYSRAGGYNTICYENDISEKMVKEYRLRMQN